MAQSFQVVLLLTLTLAARAAGDSHTAILGNWLTADRSGIIRITLQPDGTYAGSIAGGNQPGRADTKNPDAQLRARPLLGAVLLSGLRPDGDRKWTGGTIYDPNSGRTYRCNAELVGADRLKLRGFIGFTLLGRNELWTRYHGTNMLPPPGAIGLGGRGERSTLAGQ